MLRVRCTVDDLLRVSFAEHPAPLAELTYAMQMLQRRDPDPVFGPWRQRMAHTLPNQARLLTHLVSPKGAGPFFLDPPDSTLAEGVERVLSTPRAEVVSELERMCSLDRPRTPWLRRLAEKDGEAWQTLEQGLVQAYGAILANRWESLRAGFYAEIAWRARTLARHGLHATLTGLSPAIRFSGTTLEADFPRDIEITLAGNGITLQPALVWTGHPLIDYKPGEPLVLIYPALTPLPLLGAPESRDDPLTALLGATRAQALRSLTREQTTTDLAKELSTTIAAASRQAKTLRQAGLIASYRDGKAVWHGCTRLGLDLLTSQSGVSDAGRFAS
ncbi:ArsR/SmtB family transcription factor [Nocardia arthritidis]|uniref:ArsR family transcriptional regulator n=1 Tax=Nocardia arthritidis TaxID=228602 RepID=A0A6G9YHX6_9NOCA|nr:DUF5937 family protein [Nocardia arthritidis]QIS12812.1 ArsR family transcriptional regulator [Nocardia arthritidis]